MGFLFSADEIRSMTAEQQRAIVESLVAAAFVDGEVSAPEAARFEQAIMGIPWSAAGVADGVILGWITEIKTHLSTMIQSERILALIREAAGCIPTQQAREKVLYLMVSITSADGNINEEEQELLNAFSNAFALPTASLGKIAAAVLTGKS